MVLTIVLLLLCFSLAQGYVQCPPINPPPTNSVCNTTGTITNPSIIASSQGYFRELKCINLCLSDGACAAYSWDPEVYFCTAYYQSIAPQDFMPETNTSAKYTDRSCYDCSKYCPASPTSNALRNGGFDDSDTSLSPWTLRKGACPNSGIVSPGYKSPNAFVFRDLIYYFDCVLTQRHFTILCPDTTYSMSFWYKVVGGDTSPASIVFEDLGTLGSLQVTLSAPKWTYFEAYFKPSLGDSVAEYLISPATNFTSQLYLDDFRISPVEKRIAPKPGAPELFVNGGFENGHVAPWQLQVGNDFSNQPNPDQYLGRPWS